MRRSEQWPEAREAHLKSEPKCQGCGGTDHLQVHHIQPFHEHPELELDQANLITLCEHPAHDCHFHFGHLLDWYSSNPQVREDAAAYLEKVKDRL
jgi:5-methylcytosine-specific restriction endonuclease McrA